MIGDILRSLEGQEVTLEFNLGGGESLNFYGIVVPHVEMIEVRRVFKAPLQVVISVTFDPRDATSVCAERTGGVIVKAEVAY